MCNSSEFLVLNEDVTLDVDEQYAIAALPLDDEPHWRAFFTQADAAMIADA